MRAARTQARIDSGLQTIAGVNNYCLEKEVPIDIIEVDNTALSLERVVNEVYEGRQQRSRSG